MIKYTNEIKQFILDNYKGISTAELVDRINKNYNIKATVSQLQSYKKSHNLKSGYSTRFIKGQPSYNKGVKMTKEIYEKAKPTMFQKGNRPHNHKAVGSEVLSKDGYIEVKIEEPNKWRFKHNLIWEAQYGTIPKGAVVIFLDGNRQNIDISNLKLITRKELLIMNMNRLFSENQELTEVGVNVAKLISTRNSAKKRRKGQR